MTAIKMIAVGKKLANIYSELSQPLCKKYGINQSCFDVLMFCANNPENQERNCFRCGRNAYSKRIFNPYGRYLGQANSPSCAD